MPIEDRFTVKPGPGAKRLAGAQILEAAARLSRYHPDEAAAADIRVVTGWGGRVKWLDVTVPELEPAGDVYPPTVALPALAAGDQGAGQPWFPEDR